jgi:outer membrane protein insertion porin family
MRRAAPAALALLLALGALARGGGAPAPKDPATGKLILEVKVEGLTTLKPADVIRAMATRKGRRFHPATYREDFTRIYNLGMFDAHNVILHKPEIVEGGVRIRVTCRERPVVFKVVIRGNRHLSAGGILGKAREEKSLLRKGDRYDLYAAHRMAQSIKEYGRSRRFPLVKVKTKTEPVPGMPGYVFAVFEVDDGEKVYIRNVTFRGRKSLPRKKLLKAIESRPKRFLSGGGKFDEDTLRVDAIRLQSLYRNSGYSDARVEPLPARIGPPMGRWRRRYAAVTFEIREGRKYTYGPITFKGLKSVPEKKARIEIARVLGVKPRKRAFEGGLARLFTDMSPETVLASLSSLPHSEDRILAARKRLKDLLGETGRPFSRVMHRRVRTDKQGLVGLEFTVVEGPQATVGEIRIKGNIRTRDRIIRREMKLLPGDIYDSRKLNRSKNKVRSRGLFARVQSYNVPGDEPDTVDIELEVEEARTGYLHIGGYVAPEDGSVGGTVGISERNFDWKRFPKSWDDLANGGGFRGGAQRLGFNSNLSETIKSFKLTFDNPWIWDTPEHYGFGGALFYTDKDFRDYEDQRAGVSLKLSRRLFHDRLRAWLGYTYQSIYVEGMDDDLPDEILDNDEGHTQLASMQFGLSYDGRNSRLMPTKGVLLEATEEIFGGMFDGDHDLRKTSVRGHMWLPLFSTYGHPHVFHFYSRADWANPYDLSERVPFFERYFAGGIGTVRGYDYRTISPRVDGEEVGGNFRLVENFEYIFPLHKDILRGVVFFDAGSVWAEEGDFDLHDQRRSIGLGIHIKTPMGPIPIKLYFAKAINPREGDDEQVFQMSFSLLF